ncbi:cilia- and flagella-associated protein 53-like [Cylas formicarius]|uniref:cilia- and flagella-associated protein 53-like n=1 Tax=Cylas formicarius TaxID=197179 RepID=UPI0029588A0D|nr:cilia- and flagella-associated protein 53-like [Cylas formicarius]
MFGAPFNSQDHPQSTINEICTTEPPKKNKDDLRVDRRPINEVFFNGKYDEHERGKQFKKEIRDRVLEKLKAYDDSVEERRKKLRELLCIEERQFYYETINNIQKKQDLKMAEMKQRAELLKAQREAERLELVRQKRITQYRNKCPESTPKLIQKNLIESKQIQLQQIKENEARRQADRELERMWHELCAKELEVKRKREAQDLEERKNRQKEIADTWKKQMECKKLLKDEYEQGTHEETMEMKKLAEELKIEEIKALRAKQKKRDETAKQLLEQIAHQDRLQAERREQENALDKALINLTQVELEREKASWKEQSERARRETELYRKHLRDLEKQRKLEEEKLDELLEIHRKSIEAKHNEARCKLIEAKRKLQQDVLAERAQQIKYKRQEAEERLKLKQAENELLLIAFETNERLQAESNRLELQAALQYRDDLKRQIEYNNISRQKEKEELEKQLQEGAKEEEEYKNMVEQIIKEELNQKGNHPFRRALEQCSCRSAP